MDKLYITEITFKDNNYILEIFDKNVFKTIKEEVKNIKDIFKNQFKKIEINIFNIKNKNNNNIINYEILDNELYKKYYNYLLDNKKYPIKNLKKLLNTKLEYNATYIHYSTDIF